MNVAERVGVGVGVGVRVSVGVRKIDVVDEYRIH